MKFSFNEFVNEGMLASIKKLTIQEILTRLSLIGWSVTMTSSILAIYTNLANRKVRLKNQIREEEDSRVKKAMLDELKKLNNKEENLKEKINKINDSAKKKYDSLPEEEKAKMREKGKKAKMKFIKKQSK